MVPLYSIKRAELIAELPKMSRNHGTSLETLRKGSYRVNGEESCSVFLNPQNDVFIKIETHDGVYYFSGGTDAETQAAYAGLGYTKNK